MRKWTEVVRSYPDLTSGTFYTARVKGIKKVGRPRVMEIDLELQETSQQGRQVMVQLPLPVRHASLIARFFSACGQVVSPKATIAPCDAVNALVKVSFEKTADGQNWQAADFGSLSERAKP